MKDKTLTFDDLVVRSGGNVFKQYSSSVVLINTGVGHGSGFLITEDAIITNWHVIKGYDAVGVIFKPRGFNKVDLKNQYIADIVLTDQVRDIALLILRKHGRSIIPDYLLYQPHREGYPIEFVAKGMQNEDMEIVTKGVEMQEEFLQYVIEVGYLKPWEEPYFVSYAISILSRNLIK